MKWWGKWWGIMLIVVGSIIGFIIFTILAAAIFVFFEESPQYINNSENYESISNIPPEIMNETVSLTYDDLFRNSKEHEGKIVSYTGKILQNIEYEKYTNIRMSTERNRIYDTGYGYEDVLYLFYYGDKRWVDGDIIKIVGISLGDTSYDTTEGEEITIPGIGVYAIDLLTTEEASLDPVIEKMKKSIVWVRYNYTWGTYSSYDELVSGTGVIYDEDNSSYYIFTNRHVIDFLYDGTDVEIISGDVKVRTQDGTLHSVKKIYYAPHELDIAILKIDKTGNYKTAKIKTENINLGDEVIAIGYPGFAAKVLEFSTKYGKITSFRDLLMIDGYAFDAIESDAYISYGSSGGGLFDSEGNLIGITTWKVNSKENIAIKVDAIESIDEFKSCSENLYLKNGECIEYGLKLRCGIFEMEADGECVSCGFLNDQCCPSSECFFGNCIDNICVWGL